MKMMQRFSSLALLLLLAVPCVHAQQPVPERPRILVSTDIGGTDPDDNQSMIHLLMYSDLFDIEGLVSSPSFGNGSKSELLRMIDRYAQDYRQLKQCYPGLLVPRHLRRLCKQGRRGLAGYSGYSEQTEGSRWIVKCARRKDPRPLWVLVWGTLEDVAQALHDAPDIESRIRVYWIGGPNKKWGVNSYAYVAGHHPNLWMIENNASYRGIITDNAVMELIETFDGRAIGGHVDERTQRYGKHFYSYAVQDAGVMGDDFINYYGGTVKMGDTPSLLYMMDGDPANPMRESWGGQFEPTRRSSRRVFNHPLTLQDTIPVYGVMELRFRGPHQDVATDGMFTMTVDKQQWIGYYLGDGIYGVRYSPKAPATLAYSISSPVPELDGLHGEFVVSTLWPGAPCADDYQLGPNWYTDMQSPDLFEGKWQGVKTVRKWRVDVLEHWKQRWDCLKNQEPKDHKKRTGRWTEDY